NLGRWSSDGLHAGHVRRRGSFGECDVHRDGRPEGELIGHVHLQQLLHRDTDGHQPERGAQSNPRPRLRQVRSKCSNFESTTTPNDLVIKGKGTITWMAGGIGSVKK